MIEYKTVLELKQALNKFPDNALVEISELPEKLSKHGLTTIFNGEEVLICEFHDYEKEDKKEEFLKIEELDFNENLHLRDQITIPELQYEHIDIEENFDLIIEEQIKLERMIGERTRRLLNLGVKDIKVDLIDDFGLVINYSNQLKSTDIKDISSDEYDLFYFFDENKPDQEIGKEILNKTQKYKPSIIIKKNKPKNYHPGKLCAIWYDLPVSGICIETGKQVNFFFGNILWDMEGVVDGGIPVYINKNGEIKDVIVHHQSLTLLFPEKPEEMTPLQKLALFALPFSHWKPENANNSQPEIQ